MNRFDGQTAIVTGAAKGIGLGIARRIAEEGASVALLDIDEPAVMASARALAADGLRVAAFAASPECSFTTGFTFDCSGGGAVY